MHSIKHLGFHSHLEFCQMQRLFEMLCNRNYIALCNTVCGVPVEALGGVRNLQVLNPTMTTLNVRWEPAEGKVKEYKVVYAPAAGGAESMVGLVGLLESTKE